MTAEELKQEFVRRYAPRHEFTDKDRPYLKFIEKLDEYVDEVNRKTSIEFIKDIDEKSSLMILCDRCKPAFDMLDDEQYESMFDEWKGEAK